MVRSHLLALLLLGVSSEAASLKLELLTNTKVEPKETRVHLQLKNTGTETVRVLTDDYFSLQSARLVDSRGKELVAFDSRSVRGMARPPDQATYVDLAAGKSIDLAGLSLVNVSGLALASDLTWHLKEIAGQTVTVEFTYEVSKEIAAQAGKMRAPKLTVGKWKSAAVKVVVPKP